MKPIVFIPLVLIAFFSGCTNSSMRPVWTEPIRQQQAAFLWKNSQGTIAGEATIITDSTGNVRFRLTKSLPSPVLEILSVPTGRIRISGPIAGGTWSGDPSRVPKKLALWPSLISAWQATTSAPDGRQEIHSASHRAALWKKDRRVRELCVSSSDNGEVILLVFR